MPSSTVVSSSVTLARRKKLEFFGQVTAESAETSPKTPLDRYIENSPL